MLLLIGAIAGVTLGPMGLARVVPEAYQRAFVGGGQPQQELDTFDRDVLERRQRLEKTGVTSPALVEFNERHQTDRNLIEVRVLLERRQHLERLIGWAVGLVLAVVVVMGIESLLTGPSVHRLAISRHALIAVWLTLMLAQPKLIESVPIVFTGLLVLVALAVSLVPLGKRGR